MNVSAGELRHRVRIQRLGAHTAIDSAGSEPWETVGETQAAIRDVLPSRGEQLSDGMTMTTRPARLRVRYRTDITADMRFQVLRNVAGVWVVSRTLQIVSGPAVLGNNKGLEFMVEEYRPAGAGA